MIRRDEVTANKTGKKQKSKVEDEKWGGVQPALNC